MGIGKISAYLLVLNMLFCPFSHCESPGKNYSCCPNKGLKDKNKKVAIVSGLSIVGSMAAITLAKAGYQVICFEHRQNYTRNIQWAVRQTLVNELASIEANLAGAFLKKIVSPINEGSIHISIDGYRRTKSHLGLSEGNPKKVPHTCKEMMSSPSVGIVEAKSFEAFLRTYLETFPNVLIRKEFFELEKSNEYLGGGHPPADLIVIAEGANSASREKLGIQLESTAPNKLQIAGTIEIDGNGVMLKHWRKEDKKIKLSGAMGGAGFGKIWLVADISPDKLETQDLINKEFYRLAAATLDLPYETIIQKKISGLSEDKKIAPFLLKRSICHTATKGNVILIGDSVGTGHWHVGGGMQTGAICHIERLKKLISDLEEKFLSKKDALERYSIDVREDTKTWIEISKKEVPYTRKKLKESKQSIGYFVVNSWQLIKFSA